LTLCVRGVNLFIEIASRVESNWRDADRIGSRMNDGTRAPVGETIESSQHIFTIRQRRRSIGRASASLSSHLLPTPKLAAEMRCDIDTWAVRERIIERRCVGEIALNAE